MLLMSVSLNLQAWKKCQTAGLMVSENIKGPKKTRIKQQNLCRSILKFQKGRIHKIKKEYERKKYVYIGQMLNRPNLYIAVVCAAGLWHRRYFF